jgi:hypothetical protein
MNKSKFLYLFLLLYFLTTMAFSQSLGSEFSYQGKLLDDSGLANGNYDFRFILLDGENPNTANEISSDSVFNVIVDNGIFNLTLDFGDVYDGSNYWVEIEVKESNSLYFETLSPAQPLQAVPYAQYALSGNEGPQGPQGVQGPIGPPGPHTNSIHICRNGSEPPSGCSAVCTGRVIVDTGAHQANCKVSSDLGECNANGSSFSYTRCCVCDQNPE